MNAHLGKRDPVKQGHRTPPEFLHAVFARFGRIGFDLAAENFNVSVASEFFSPEDDALSKNWTLPHLIGIAWLNPPFSHVGPWMKKLHDECRFLPRWTIALVQASSDSNWWQRYVHNKCMVFDIPRVTFVGEKHVFPKPLACLAYGYGVCRRDFWDWRE